MWTPRLTEAMEVPCGPHASREDWWVPWAPRMGPQMHLEGPAGEGGAPGQCSTSGCFIDQSRKAESNISFRKKKKCHH